MVVLSSAVETNPIEPQGTQRYAEVRRRAGTAETPYAEGQEPKRSLVAVATMPNRGLAARMASDRPGSRGRVSDQRGPRPEGTKRSSLRSVWPPHGPHSPDSVMYWIRQRGQ